MPIIKRNSNDFMASERQSVDPQFSTSIDTYTAVTDFLKTENSLANIAEGLNGMIFNKFEADPLYEPIEDMVGYEGYADDLQSARSKKEMSYLKSKIDLEKQRRENFAVADGWQKAAGIGALLVSDPMVIIPVGSTAYKTYRTTGRIFEGATKTAGIGMAMETANEAILQSNQITRTNEESLYNIAATTALSGILGGAAGGLSKVEYKNLLKKFENDMTVPTDQQLSTAGAQKVGTTFEQEEIAGLSRLKKIYSVMPSFMKNPVLNTAISNSKKVRDLSEGLADLSLAKQKNAEFIASEASIESLVKSYDTLRVPFYESKNKLYKAYTTRIKNEDIPINQRIGSGKNNSLTQQEFNEQVWVAGINNDTHIIPEVQDLARVVRKEVFDPILKRAEEVGIFKDVDDMDVKTAESWVKRMYDKEAIINNRTEFKKIVLDDLKQKRQADADSIPVLEKNIISSKDSIKNTRRELNIKTKESFNATYNEVNKTIKNELNETISFDDFKEGFILSKTKPKTTDEQDAALKSKINNEIRKSVRDLYKRQVQKELDDVEEELRLDTLNLIKGFSNDLDDLGITADDLYGEISDQIGVLSGKDVGIDFSIWEKVIANEIINKINSSKKKTNILDLDADKLNKIIDDKLSSFIKSRSHRAAKRAGKQAAKEAGKELKLQLRALIKDLKDQKKGLSKAQFRSKFMDEELNDTAEQLIDRITNATAGRLPYDLKMQSGRYKPTEQGLRGSAKARVWNIEDIKIQDYLVKDITQIVESHIRTMAPDNEIMGRFGTLDFDPIKKQIQEDYNQLRNGKVKDKKSGEMRARTNKELSKLDREMKRDINDLKAMHEKLRGTYAQPDDYSAPQHVLERTALGWNFVRLLGDIVASSAPDAGRHIMVHGFSKTYGKLIESVMKDIEGLKMSASEMKEIGLSLDIVNAMTTLKRMNMDEYSYGAGKVDYVTDKVTSFASTATGMNHWQAMQKSFAGIMIQNRMLESINEFASTGKIPQKEVINLASHGIGRDEAIEIAAQFKKHGEKREVLNIANARNWDNAAVRNKFRSAIRKQADEIVVTPGLDRPLWMSRPGWRTIGQFKSFSFSSTQRVLMAGMQQNDAQFYQGMVSMIAIGSLVYAYKTMMYGGTLSDDPRKWIVEGVDRSGITGIAMDANNILEKITRGSIGINPIIGGEPMSRYASRNAVGALLGPSFGMAQDIFTTTGAVFSGDVSQSDIHAARKLIPLQNAPYIRGLFDAGERGLAETLGVQ